MAFGCASRRHRRCALAAAGLVMAAAHGHAEPSGLPHADDELVIGVPEAVSSINPLAYTRYEDFVLGFAHRRLALPDQSWHLACGLCTVLPSLENGRIKLVPAPGGGQGMEVTYTLQPGARWADGEPVTSQDVAFTVDVAKQPESGLPNAVLLRNLRDVRVIDDKTFVLIYDHAEVGLSAPDVLAVLPKHVEGPIFGGLADKRDYLKHSAYRTTPTAPGLWMGPYRLAEFGAGKYVVFERNPYWFGEKPYFRKITLRFYPSSTQAEAGLFAGETDLLQEGTLPLRLADDVKKRLSDAFTVRTEPSATLLSIVVNLDRPNLKDERLRRALLLAIDRKAIARDLFGDERAVAYSFLAPQDPGYSKTVPEVPFDPAAAAQELRDAGYRKNEAGRWQDEAGTPLALNLSINAGSAPAQAVGSRIIVDWERLGIGAALVSDPLLLAQTLQHRQFELALFGLTPTPEYVPVTTLASAAIPTVANNFAGQNYAGLASPEIDALLQNLMGELDTSKRPTLWAKLQQQWAALLPALPLIDLPQLYVVPRWLSGFEPTGHEIPSSDFCEMWSRHR